MLTWKPPNQGLFYWRSLPHISDTLRLVYSWELLFANTASLVA
ncbi:MAG: hypothetical protein RMX97_07050 [Nostoc sp. DedQUE11]|nr:hypothetical protein [Nostoc sp. DedQUE11]MDZ8075943.1 hypothetical protein [Nostoc sp. DedQUE01]